MAFGSGDSKVGDAENRGKGLGWPSLLAESSIGKEFCWGWGYCHRAWRACPGVCDFALLMEQGVSGSETFLY